MTIHDEALLDRLRQHRALSPAPEEELRWLFERGRFESGRAGEVFVRHGEFIGRMWALLSGRIAFYTRRGSGRGKIMEWFPGDLAGVLPFSRLKGAPGDAVAEEDIEMFTLDVEHFPEMIRTAPTITGVCVHAMLDRARHFTREGLQDDKLMSLGRLSAGLAHELNNPASAAARSAKLLQSAIAAASEAAFAIGSTGLSAEQQQLIQRVRDEAPGSTTRLWSAVDFSDREDTIDEWLNEHGIDPELTATLAETALTTSDLDGLAEGLSREQLHAAITWIASDYAASTLANELQRSAERIHNIVSSVKRYTYVGRGTGAEPTDIVPGIEDTLTMLAFKARSRAANIHTEFAPELPPAMAFGGELNQVWQNLMDNALDAIEPGGSITVRAYSRRDRVIVEVVDSGSGIDPEIRDRIFDPFFTTKDVGQGSGLGLDVVRRIVVRHSGEVEVESEPGSTIFRVALPVASQALAAR